MCTGSGRDADDDIGDARHGCRVWDPEACAAGGSRLEAAVVALHAKSSLENARLMRRYVVVMSGDANVGCE